MDYQPLHLRTQKPQSLVFLLAQHLLLQQFH